jgi:hypothetical protein
MIKGHGSGPSSKTGDEEMRRRVEMESCREYVLVISHA